MSDTLRLTPVYSRALVLESDEEGCGGSVSFVDDNDLVLELVAIVGGGGGGATLADVANLMAFAAAHG